ncbi:MAG: hypothetical protein CMJ72_15435 [Planctomycetaceae bacterium]|nr:hypothetical protein [Planctomycetaceae bacterium]
MQQHIAPPGSVSFRNCSGLPARLLPITRGTTSEAILQFRDLHGKKLSFRSLYPGGLHFFLVDSSVHFTLHQQNDLLGHLLSAEYQK